MTYLSWGMAVAGALQCSHSPLVACWCCWIRKDFRAPGRKKGNKNLFQQHKSLRLTGYNTVPAEHWPWRTSGMAGVTSCIASCSSGLAPRARLTSRQHSKSGFP